MSYAVDLWSANVSYSADQSFISSVRQEGEPLGAAVMPQALLQGLLSSKRALTGITQ